ncbi:alpha/beta hydrolase-fold protein [Microbacterium pseudoresistens]|uniref:Enterochelin esterase-like enzyme n=1 Tax=Microbacterium pseudoresistens TaxID=640634 RepID=A0A7Y9ET84_9MICO|nr:alpha/beta hydrolase-fold protein [Microbacterium pseudoresistens]NYD53533.1 enterochelin esterase-like enzyme [Microbacterium pseudoresistens]
MPPWLLRIDVVDGPFPSIVWGVTALLVLVLLLRRPTSRWMLRAAIGILAGALIGVVLVTVVDATQAFGGTTPRGTVWWIAAGFAALGLAIVSLWDSRAWRKIVAIVTVILVLISTFLGVNALFGIDRTLGSLFGISSLQEADDLPGPNPSISPTGPLYASWTPPSDLPAKGQVRQLSGTHAIPSSAGFVARDASVYLPPAALVAEPPALPVVVFMMGKPGNPDPSFVQDALDGLAAKNKGLAPIVIVADQLGNPDANPACVDSKTYGGVSTYFNTDIPAFISANLPVVSDHAQWTIGGYSNGGACALVWAGKHPEIWGNIISISGEEFPGSEEQDTVLREVFGGDSASYAAAKPDAVLAAGKGRYDSHVAVFTVGENDPAYIPGARSSAKLAQAAGFTTTFQIIAGADHVVTALNGGLPFAFGVLYPRLGLSAPAG